MDMSGFKFDFDEITRVISEQSAIETNEIIEKINKEADETNENTAVTFNKITNEFINSSINTSGRVLKKYHEALILYLSDIDAK